MSANDTGRNPSFSSTVPSTSVLINSSTRYNMFPKPWKCACTSTEKKKRKRRDMLMADMDDDNSELHALMVSMTSRALTPALIFFESMYAQQRLHCELDLQG